MKCYLLESMSVSHIYMGLQPKNKGHGHSQFSDRQKISKWQKNSVLVKNVEKVIHFYHIPAYPSTQSSYSI